MDLITRLFWRFSNKAQAARYEIFRRSFVLNKNTKILDIGGASGHHINRVLKGTKVQPHNVYIANIKPKVNKEANFIYGYKTILIKEDEGLPYPDYYFDIVYCNSVIEHVTVPKSEIWEIRSGQEFKKKSLVNQNRFSHEIRRLSKQYFVQTPNKHFPIEAHSWLPLLGWFPRRILLPVLKITNRFWVKDTPPDWNLLVRKEMRWLFPDAKLVMEKKWGLIKSIMAIKSQNMLRKHEKK